MLFLYLFGFYLIGFFFKMEKKTDGLFYIFCVKEKKDSFKLQHCQTKEAENASE